MAANKKLLNKFAKTFQSATLFNATQAMLCGKTILEKLYPNKDFSELRRTQLDVQFKEVMNDKNITDDTLINAIAEMDTASLQTISIDLMAEVIDSKAFARLDEAHRSRLAPAIEALFHLENVNACNPSDVILHEEAYRSLAKNLTKPEDLATTNDKIDKIKDNFIKLRGGEANIKRSLNLLNRAKFEDDKDIVAKLDYSDSLFYGNTAARTICDIRAQAIANQPDGKAKQSMAVMEAIAHDEEIAACEKILNVKTGTNHKAYISSKFAAGTKKEPPFWPTLVSSFGKTLTQSTIASLGMGLIRPVVTKAVGNVATKVAANASEMGFVSGILTKVPGVGNIVGPLMAGAAGFLTFRRQMRNMVKEAEREGRSVNNWDKAKLAINVAASVAPYAIMMAGGTTGRGLGAIINAAKTFTFDMINKRDQLKMMSAGEIWQEIGKSGLKGLSQGAAMFIGSNIGNMMSDAIVSNLSENYQIKPDQATEQQETAQEQTEQTEQTENITKQQDSTVSEQSGATAAEQQGANELATDSATTETADVTKTGAAPEEEFIDMKTHRFDLTDNARRTANPANHRMYINGERQDWYTQDEYEQAISVLKNEYEDADGALRVLASASILKGGNYETELKNLLSGQEISEQTRNMIKSAAGIIDRTGGLNDLQTSLSENIVKKAQEAAVDLDLSTDNTIDLGATITDQNLDLGSATGLDVDAVAATSLENTTSETWFDKSVEPVLNAPVSEASSLEIQNTPVPPPSLEVDETGVLNDSKISLDYVDDKLQADVLRSGDGSYKDSPAMETYSQGKVLETDALANNQLDQPTNHVQFNDESAPTNVNTPNTPQTSIKTDISAMTPESTGLQQSIHHKSPTNAGLQTEDTASKTIAEKTIKDTIKNPTEAAVGNAELDPQPYSIKSISEMLDQYGTPEFKDPEKVTRYLSIIKTPVPPRPLGGGEIVDINGYNIPLDYIGDSTRAEILRAVDGTYDDFPSIKQQIIKDAIKISSLNRGIWHHLTNYAEKNANQIATSTATFFPNTSDLQYDATRNILTQVQERCRFLPAEQRNEMVNNMHHICASLDKYTTKFLDKGIGANLARKKAYDMVFFGKSQNVKMAYDAGFDLNKAYKALLETLQSEKDKSL